jgi:hypothetical protein
MSEDAVRRQVTLAEQLLAYIQHHREDTPPEVKQRIRDYFSDHKRGDNLRTEYGAEACSD